MSNAEMISMLKDLNKEIEKNKVTEENYVKFRTEPGYFKKHFKSVTGNEMDDDSVRLFTNLMSKLKVDKSSKAKEVQKILDYVNTQPRSSGWFGSNFMGTDANDIFQKKVKEDYFK